MSSFLNSIVGALTGGGAQGGTQGGGLMQLAQIAMRNPQLMQVVAAMFTADNKHGGLQGMLQKFQQSGYGDAAQSWVSEGDNAQVTGAQIEEVFGTAGIDRIAQKAGVSRAEAPDMLSQILPQLINGLTQGGKPPAHAPQSSDDILGMLGNLLGRR